MGATPTKERKPPFIEAVWALAKVGSNASLAGKISESLQKLAQGGPLPEGYFRIDDLKNPAPAYWARKVEIEEPTDIARRMTVGKRKHRQAGFWFRGLRDFIMGEGRLEGAYVGVQGVVGKIDFLLGRSVLEYKTKDGLPETPDAVWEDYPHDIEQTVFYAILLPNSSETHYLLFDDRGAFRAFRLRLRDREVVKALLIQRKKNLRDAIDCNDPTSLGRCRYLEPGCKFARANKCRCADLPMLETSGLRRAIEVTRDPEFEKQVADAYASSAFPPEEIWWWDLFAPRRRFLEEPPTYSSATEKNAARWLLEEGVRGMGLNVDRASYEAAALGAATLGVRAPVGLVHVMRVREPNGREIVPYIARAQRGLVKREWQVTPYHIAELAIACAAADSKRGVIFIVYPEDGNKVAAYDVSFSDLDKVKEHVKDAVRQIRAAEEANDPELAPECPSWMRAGCSPKCLCTHAGGDDG